jgi:hypothetical protein
MFRVNTTHKHPTETTHHLQCCSEPVNPHAWKGCDAHTTAGFNQPISGLALRLELRHKPAKAEVGVNSIQNESG